VCINSENGIMDEAHEKLKQILDLASAEDNEKLRSELAKMIPTAENSKVTTKIGWGHHDKLIQTSFTFTVFSYSENIGTNTNGNLLFSDFFNN